MGERLRVVDVTNPAAPIAIGQTSAFTPSTILDAELSGNKVYAAASGQGFYIFDVSNPRRPNVLGSYDTPGTARSVALSGGYAYVADDTWGLLGNPWVIDVSNPQNPQKVGSLPVLGRPYDVVISGTHAYLAAYTCFYIVDISTPLSPTITGVYTTSSCIDVALYGSYAYLSRGTYGLDVIDVSNPANPQWRYNLSRPAGPMAVSGSYGYLTLVFAAFRSGPFQPGTTLRAQLCPSARYTSLSGNCVRGLRLCRRRPGGLSIVNVSNRPGTHYCAQPAA